MLQTVAWLVKGDDGEIESAEWSGIDRVSTRATLSAEHPKGWSGQNGASFPQEEKLAFYSHLGDFLKSKA
jgi:hypothetical protein